MRTIFEDEGHLEFHECEKEGDRTSWSMAKSKTPFAIVIGKGKRDNFFDLVPVGSESGRVFLRSKKEGEQSWKYFVLPQAFRISHVNGHYVVYQSDDPQLVFVDMSAVESQYVVVTEKNEEPVEGDSEAVAAIIDLKENDIFWFDDLESFDMTVCEWGLTEGVDLSSIPRPSYSHANRKYAFKEEDFSELKADQSVFGFDGIVPEPEQPQ